MCYTAINNMTSILKSLLTLYGAHCIRSLFTAMAVGYVVGSLFLLVSFILADSLVLYRLLRRLVCYIRSSQMSIWIRVAVVILLMLAIPLSGFAFLTLCTILHTLEPTMSTICFLVGIVGLVISFVVVAVVVVVRLLLGLLYRLACSVKRLATWMLQRHRNLPLVQMETEDIKIDVQQDMEWLELEMEVIFDLPTLQPPAPRRSGRIRKPPDRWVPTTTTSSHTIAPVPLGSFFDRGVRRSSRIAARMAVL